MRVCVYCTCCGIIIQALRQPICKASAIVGDTRKNAAARSLEMYCTSMKKIANYKHRHTSSGSWWKYPEAKSRSADLEKQPPYCAVCCFMKGGKNWKQMCPLYVIGPYRICENQLENRNYRSMANWRGSRHHDITVSNLIFIERENLTRISEASRATVARINIWDEIAIVLYAEKLRTGYGRL